MDEFNAKKQPILSILTLSFEVFSKNFKFVVIAGLLIVLPLNLILLLIPMPSAVEIQNFVVYSLANQSADEIYNSPEIKKLLGYIYSIFAALIIFNPLTAAAAAFLTKRHIGLAKNESYDLFSSETKIPDNTMFHGLLDATIIKWGKHIVTSIMYNLLLCLFFMPAAAFLMSGIAFPLGIVLLIPAVTYGIGYSFYAIVVATDNKWGRSALHESYRAVKGQFRGAFGFVVFNWALSYLFTLVFTIAMELILFVAVAIVPVDAFITVLNFIGSVVCESLKLFFQIMTAVWFFNRLHFAGRVQSIAN